MAHLGGPADHYAAAASKGFSFAQLREAVVLSAQFADESVPLGPESAHR